MITIIVAVSVSGIIGIRGSHKLLWKSEVDLDFFKRTTLGQTVVMGNDTFKTLGKALPGRKNVVLSRKEKPGHRNGVQYCNSVGEIIATYSEFTVIGGESIYNTFLPVADHVILTTLSLDFEGEENYAYFPLDKMEQEFYMVDESAIINDEDQMSGIPLNLIVTRWQRGIPNVH